MCAKAHDTSAGYPTRGCLWALRGTGTLASGAWSVTFQDRDFDPAKLPRDRGNLPTWPGEPPTMVYDKVGSRPDFAPYLSQVRPYCIVSDRFRTFLESQHSGSAAFLPIHVHGPNRSALHRVYWFTQFLLTWECQPNQNSAELDARSVPEDQPIGLVAGKGWWWGGAAVCGTTFKALLQKEKFVGLSFDRCPLLSRSKDVITVRTGTGKTAKIARECIPTDRHFNVDAFLKEFPGTSYKSKTPNSNALVDYVGLHSAMNGVSLRALRKLLEAGYDPNEANGHPNVSPVAVSIAPKSPSVLKLLHKHGVHWNVSNSVGVTPLMSAMGSAKSAIELLLSFGADAAARSLTGQTALHCLCDTWYVYRVDTFRDIAVMLRDTGATLNVADADGCTPSDLLEQDRLRSTPAERRRLDQIQRVFQEVFDKEPRSNARSARPGESSPRRTRRPTKK